MTLYAELFAILKLIHINFKLFGKEKVIRRVIVAVDENCNKNFSRLPKSELFQYFYVFLSSIRSRTVLCFISFMNSKIHRNIK